MDRKKVERKKKEMDRKTTNRRRMKIERKEENIEEKLSFDLYILRNT